MIGMPPDDGDRSRRVVAWLAAAPAVLVAIGLCGMEVYRDLRPESSLFRPPFTYSLAEAIAERDLAAAYEFLREGQDPGGLIRVQDETLTGGRPALVSPLLWAVGKQNRDAVLMLLGFGAPMDATLERRAVCLAERLGNTELARLLREHGSGAPTGDCAEEIRELIG